MTFPGTDRSVLSGLMRDAADIEAGLRSWMCRSGGGTSFYSRHPCYRRQNLGELGMLGMRFCTSTVFRSRRVRTRRIDLAGEEIAPVVECSEI